ncbi:hypothetical protein [Streptomyces brasiliensis]|uniref:Uncharacterized protein n=1 Tax=Streptomyces brasiliensis TaxID=1954 RepID=A0A917PBL8_9ACTN|nr:hypothetical protein [Streptomyces brasiliensis]GGJ69856.1 hypothetical protein GCM10010121_095610 [Streptomyces brasiliensis]
MPLDDALAARMAEPDFWPVYLFDDDAPDVYDEDAEDQESHVARFQLGGGFALVLDLTLALEYVNLALAAPSFAAPVTVGWDDQAHFHPHVMPWPELDLLCRAVALHDPELRHPGPMLALLCRFAFLAEGDDLDRVTPLVDAAFGLMRPGDGKGGVRAETRDGFDLRDLRGTGVAWTSRADGHRAIDQHRGDGLPLYSLRAPDSEDFPFAEWSALLAQARERIGVTAGDRTLRAPAVRQALDRCTAPNGYEHLAALADALSAVGYTQPVLMRAVAQPSHRAEACWAVETLSGLPQGELVPRWFGPSPLAGSESWRLSLTLPGAERPWRFGQQVAEELSTALQEAGLGRAEVGGSMSRPEGGGYVHVEDHLDLLIRDDLALGVTIIARILHSHRAAETATLRHAGEEDEVIPLRLPT